MTELRSTIAAACTGVAFWSAIVLALGYPVLLVVIDYGLLPRGAFFTFVAAHLASLLVGHRYGENTPRAGGS